MYLNVIVLFPNPALLLVGLLAIFWLPAAVRAESSVHLTSAAEVRRLSPEEANRAIPVRLRGHLLLVTVPGNAIVLYDGAEGIYVELDRPVGGDFQLGDELEVFGVSDAGDFAPIVRSNRVVSLGPSRLPAPRSSTIAELNAGGFDAAWVELRGIVRSCIPTPPDRMPISRAGAGGGEPAMPSGSPRPSWLLIIAQGDDKMMVQVNGPVAPDDLVDAEVRIRAVVFNVHNANRQFVRANLQVPDRSLIEVLAPPPADPFALPVQPIGSVLRFSRDGFTGHRVHVRGVVTGHKDGHTLWIREGGRGMRIASIQRGNLAPGDEVAIVGFPDHGGYTPSLSDAIFRQLSAGPAPAPQLLQVWEDISRQDSNLVQLYAVVREFRVTPEGATLLLDWQGKLVRARLLQEIDETEAADWEPGSHVRVQGMCLVGQTDFLRPTGLWVAEDLQILLRTPDDVAVLRAAPWLTTPRALRLVSAILGVMLVVLVVGAILARRQIAQREEARKLAEVEFTAMLAERNRLAREIHDTLAQDLNAVSMQLELARNSVPAGEQAALMPFIATAHQIVRKCLAEARESIWNMRSHILERTDLAGALRTVAEQLRSGHACEIRSSVQGRARRLAPNIENNLLRIGQEAVSNALRHARASVVEITLSYDDATVRLTVRDDGPGFDPATAQAAGSHFGLRGMKERASQMNGEFRLGPDPAGGMRLEVTVKAPDPI